MAPERGTRTEYEMKFYLRVLLRFLLIWRVAHFLYERNASTACHTTTIYVQNGTWLNVSEWYGNGLFGNIHRLPNPITVKPSYEDSNRTFVISNPALPRLPYFPTPEQDCVCGRPEVVRLSFYFIFLTSKRYNSTTFEICDITTYVIVRGNNPKGTQPNEISLNPIDITLDQKSTAEKYEQMSLEKLSL